MVASKIYHNIIKSLPLSVRTMDKTLSRCVVRSLKAMMIPKMTRFNCSIASRIVIDEYRLEIDLVMLPEKHEVNQDTHNVSD